MKKKIVFILILLSILFFIIYKTTISDEKPNIPTTSPSKSEPNTPKSESETTNKSSEGTVTVSITNLSKGSVVTDRSPTVSGTFTSETTPTITIEFYSEDNKVTNTGIANVSNGSWTYTPSTALPYGNYFIKAIITNDTGTATYLVNNLTISETKELTISINKDEKLTLNKYNPIISGTSNALDGVTAFVTIEDTTALATVESGVWSIQWPETLLEGDYNVYVSITEQNQSAEASQKISIDMTLPKISITKDTPTISNDSTPTISGKTDEISGANVFVTINNKSYSAIVNESGFWSLDIDHLEDGEYEVSASISDKARNSSTDKKTITIDTTGPIIFITSPSVSAVNKKTLIVSGTIDEGDKVTVQFADENNNIVFSENVPVVNKEWSISPNIVIPDGSYTITAFAKDSLKNLGSDSLELTIDVTSPTLNFESSIAYITNDITPTISGTTGEGDGTLVTLVVDGTSYNTKVQNGTWSIDLNELQENEYEMEATIADEAGNTTVETKMLTIDLTPPSLVIDGGENKTTNETTPILKGITDARNGATALITIGNKTFETIVSNGQWQVELSKLQDGQYVVNVSLTDVAGNRATAKQSLTIDTTGPVISITSPTLNFITKNNMPVITGTIDVDGDSLSILLFDKDNKLVAEKKLGTLDKNWKIEIEKPLIDGTYRVVVNAYDQIGNEQSVETTFTIDSIAPEIKLSNLIHESTITNATPIIEGTTSPRIDVSLIILQGDKVIIEQTIASDENGSWKFEVQEPLKDNDYRLLVTVEDNATNKRELSSLFSIDTTPPEISIVSPKNGSILSSNDITLTGNSNAGSIIKINLNNEETVQVKANQLGIWSYELGNTLALGNYEVSVVAEDLHGNGSTPIYTSFQLAKEDSSASRLFLTTESPSLIANGTDFTFLTAKLLDEDGKPVGNAEVFFSAPLGSFPEGNKAVTNADGYATVKYVSAKTESEKSQNYTVSAYANDPSDAFIGEQQLKVLYEPYVMVNVETDQEGSETKSSDNEGTSQNKRNTTPYYIAIILTSILVAGISLNVFITRRKKLLNETSKM
ncbi:hypothetical protein CIB95_10805 [Lottiidibacillus patelloidae]|uniref:Big-1 domain-containing protein n=1 Tax=Lottiidibacillus patelloidae TaxID=2670334 RepID=A0A263BSL2_9BACI|nr:Ig-like domain-containing protein [Lottiidibacillus patelloidae]OZM56703.1 hypothetical protein CIB95_10805 [Lottiidibacillus patelloidae]